MKTGEKQCDEAWKKFLTKHSGMSSLMIGGVVVAAIAAIFVFLQVVADAQASGLVPVALGQWTVGYCIIFILNVIMWELLFVASWVIPALLIIYFKWYKQLPEEERDLYEGKKRRKKTAEDSGFSCVVGLVWLVLVWIYGKWNVPFQDWTFNDWVYSWLGACLSVLLVVGILGGMYVIWSLTASTPEKKGEKGKS